MATSQASSRVVTVAKQATEGVLPAQADGRLIRRSTFVLDPTKDPFQTTEKRRDGQEADVRFGPESSQGNSQSELFGGSFEEELGAVLRREFDTVGAVNAAPGEGFSTAGGVLTRDGGSFITAGLRNGMVIRPVGFANANDNLRNFIVTELTDLTAVLCPIGGADIADMASDEGVSLAVPGKRSFIPCEGHTSPLFTYEDYDSNTGYSRVTPDVILGGFGLRVPATGPATIDFTPLRGGRQQLFGPATDNDAILSGQAPYFVQPTGCAPTLGGYAASPGIILLGGRKIGCITGFNLDVNLGVTTGNSSEIKTFYGARASITGQISSFIEDEDFWKTFSGELEVGIAGVYQRPSEAGVAPAFMNFYMPRVKLTSNGRDDPDAGVTQTSDFRALLKAEDLAFEETSIMIQDSEMV